MGKTTDFPRSEKTQYACCWGEDAKAQIRCGVWQPGYAKSPGARGVRHPLYERGTAATPGAGAPTPIFLRCLRRTASGGRSTGTDGEGFCIKGDACCPPNLLHATRGARGVRANGIRYSVEKEQRRQNPPSPKLPFVKGVPRLGGGRDFAERGIRAPRMLQQSKSAATALRYQRKCVPYIGISEPCGNHRTSSFFDAKKHNAACPARSAWRTCPVISFAAK